MLTTPKAVVVIALAIAGYFVVVPFQVDTPSSIAGGICGMPIRVSAGSSATPVFDRTALAAAEREAFPNGAPVGGLETSVVAVFETRCRRGANVRLLTASYVVSAGAIAALALRSRAVSAAPNGRTGSGDGSAA